MRGNPFSLGFGKRRAAMIAREAPKSDAELVETETGLDHDPTTDEHASDELAGGSKQFGFAHRDGSDERAGTPIMPDQTNDIEPVPALVDRHAAPDMATPRDLIPAEAQTSSTDLGRSADLDDSAVSTPHIESLRAQFGDTPGETASPPLPSEAKAFPSPTTTGGCFYGSPRMSSDSPAIDHRSPLVREPVRQAEAARPIHRAGDRIEAFDEPFADENPSFSELDPDPIDEAPAFDPMEEVAITIGRVVSICGSVVWGALFDDIDGQASKAARMGALVSMRGPDSRIFGIVNRLQREQQSGNAQAERTIFEIQILGEIADENTGFRRGVSSYPPLDAPVTTITIRDIATIYARPRSSNVHIGQLRHNPKVPAFILTDGLLGKHFAVLGTTGTGKSCATTVILRSILDEHPQGHVVLIDPHNEYGAAFADRAELLNPSNLQLPYWLLNFEEIAHIVLGGASRDQMDGQAMLLKNAIVQAKVEFAGAELSDTTITVDTPVPYRLSDLVSSLKDGMATFNKSEGSGQYLGLINRIESLRSDRRFAFMFSSLMVRDNMEQVLAQLLRIPTNGKPITIIDISGLPSEVVDVVVSVLFRLTFELAVWSERGKAPPVLLVCEEAHRYVPEESGVGFAPTKRVIAQIAKEGRKYGVTLCLVSQRPSELAINSLAQCNTIFALRLGNEHDQAFVSQTLPENARWLVDSLPSLNTQEALVVGDGVTVPVHIRFKDLAQEHRPASHDPSFARSWCQEADDGFLVHAIDRWRRQAR